MRFSANYINISILDIYIEDNYTSICSTPALNPYPANVENRVSS
jgi:hypothetical protein